MIPTLPLILVILATTSAAARLRDINTSGVGPLSTDHYYTHDEMQNYLDYLAERYPELVRLEIIGKTYQNRTLRALIISKGNDSSNGNEVSQKKAILLDGGIHAREWIAPHAVLYVIHELVENHKQNRELFDKYEWYVVPLVNADGYEYSRTPGERFHRKTLQVFEEGLKCNKIDDDHIGTDPNRNFDIHWNEAKVASSDPCDPKYGGPRPFSEPEVQAMAKLIERLSKRGSLYLSVHTYGKYIIIPWSWTEERPATYELQKRIGDIGAAEIYEKTGVTFEVGNVKELLDYFSSGSSVDYAFKLGFNVSITMELNGEDFVVDPVYIDEYVKEAWYGIRAMAKEVIHNL